MEISSLTFLARKHALQVAHDHFNIAAEFPEQLPASPAGGDTFNLVLRLRRAIHLELLLHELERFLG